MEAPYNREAVDGCAVLMKMAKGMDAMKILGQDRVNADRIGRDWIGGELSGSLNGVMNIREQG